MTLNKDTRLLDPTCGSGTSIRVAKNMGALEALGIELDLETTKLAQGLLKQAPSISDTIKHITAKLQAKPI